MPTLRKALFLTLLTALALAQGRQTREDFDKQAPAGPAYIQQTFVGDLQRHLEDNFGAQRAQRMLDALRASGLTAKDVVALMNGLSTKSQLRKRFGAVGNEARLLEEALDGAILDKERKIVFGILLATMVANDVDPSSPFCKLVGQTCAQIDADDFKKLMGGNVSRSFLEESFRLKSRDDQKDMQDYVNKTRSSKLMEHPLLGSLRTGKGSGYDHSAFPKHTEETAGYGKEFADGLAAGLPFDKELPPVPFYGENLEKFFRDR